MTNHNHRKAGPQDSATADSQNDELLKPQRVAKMLDLDDGTLSNWRTLYGQSRIPFIKLSQREVRYRRSAVMEFIAERECSTPERMGRQTAGERRTPRGRK